MWTDRNSHPAGSARDAGQQRHAPILGHPARRRARLPPWRTSRARESRGMPALLSSPNFQTKPHCAPPRAGRVPAERQIFPLVSPEFKLKSTGVTRPDRPLSIAMAGVAPARKTDQRGARFASLRRCNRHCRLRWRTRSEINVTDIIWKAATVRGFNFKVFTEETVAEANPALLEFPEEGALRPTWPSPHGREAALTKENDHDPSVVSPHPARLTRYRGSSRRRRHVSCPPSPATPRPLRLPGTTQSARSASTFRKRRSSTFAGASPRRAGPSGRLSRMHPRASSSRRFRNSRAIGRRTMTGERSRPG